MPNTIEVQSECDSLKISRVMLCLFFPRAGGQPPKTLTTFFPLFLLFLIFAINRVTHHVARGDGHCDVIGIILPRDSRGVMMLLTSPIV